MSWTTYLDTKIKLIYESGESEVEITPGEAPPDGGTYLRAEVYLEPTVAHMRNQIVAHRVATAVVAGEAFTSVFRDEVNMIPDDRVATVWRSYGLEPSFDVLQAPLQNLKSNTQKCRT